jgi:hypothetical protein
MDYGPLDTPGSPSVIDEKEVIKRSVSVQMHLRFARPAGNLNYRTNDDLVQASVSPHLAPHY